MDEIIPNRSRRAFLATSAAVVAASGLNAKGSRAQTLDVSVSSLADGLNRVGIDPMSMAMTPDIKPLTGGGGTIVGSAVTTQWQPAERRMSGADVREHMFEPLDQAAPGSVWIVAGGTDRMLSLFGGVIGIACKRNGIAGAVTDNACRDVAAFDEAGFPVFGKTTVPYGPGAYARPVAANVPVVCGGVSINPGDYVAADADGVIVIPQENWQAVREAVAEVLSREQQILNKIAAGESLADAYTI
jgi:4-hydroxy-4-methyl-2-oxoglutarate aldolase